MPNDYTKVSKTEQSSKPASVKVFRMPVQIRVLNVERDGDDGLIVTFSDGTSAAYLAEELLELQREPISTPPDPKVCEARAARV